MVRAPLHVPYDIELLLLLEWPLQCESFEEFLDILGDLHFSRDDPLFSFDELGGRFLEVLGRLGLSDACDTGVLREEAS